MDYEKIETIISDIMINDGPDGHCDGSGVIADFVVALLAGTGEEWVKEYFIESRRYFSKEETE